MSATAVQASGLFKSKVSASIQAFSGPEVTNLSKKLSTSKVFNNYQFNILSDCSFIDVFGLGTCGRNMCNPQTNSMMVCCRVVGRAAAAACVTATQQRYHFRPLIKIENWPRRRSIVFPRKKGTAAAEQTDRGPSVQGRSLKHLCQVELYTVHSYQSRRLR